MNAVRTSVLGALLIAAMGSHDASAHDFWLQPQAFRWETTQSMPLSLLVGHGDHSARSKIPARRVTRFEVIGPSTLDLRDQLHADEDTNLQLNAPGAYVVVLATDNQARSDLPADRFNDYLRAEGLTPAIVAREQTGQTQAEGSERYSRQAKSLVQVGASQQQSHVTDAVGLRLEIVPEINLSDPADVSKAAISRLSDARGRAVFDMPSQGQWLLHVTWTKILPSADEADFDTVFASLTFGLPNQ
jgi:uncharacterized GH25 family protein